MSAGIHSFGRELRACQFDGMRVSETEIDRGLALTEHAHEPAQICVLLEGGFEDRTACGSRWIGPGMIHRRSPRLRHANRFADDDETLVLLLSLDRLRWSSWRDGDPIAPPIAWRTLILEMQRELRRGDDTSVMALEGLSLLLAAKLTRQTLLSREDCEPAWLADAEVYLHASFTERITLASIAARVGVHRATLAAAFRRYRRCSVGEQIRNLRIQNVMDLLETNLPLDELAQQTGFCDQAHMNRLFKRTTGVTPQQYRKLPFSPTRRRGGEGGEAG